MAPAKPIFTPETFKFLKDLGRHNHKEWMEANRDRYQAVLIQPFRRLLEELAPTALDLDARFDTSGRTGANFSRINRDIRFAKDKTLYKTHMYLKFSVPPPAKRETGQLYVGLTTDTVTAAPQPTLRELLVQDGEGRVDKILWLAGFCGRLEEDPSVDRPA